MALKWLRDQLKYLHWVLWIIVFAFIVTLFFDFGTIQPIGGNDDDVAATVGSETITYADFRREVRNLENRYRQMFGENWDPEMAEQFGLTKQALNQLIDRRILLLEAQRMGLRATDEEVQAAVIEAFSDADGFVGRDQVQRILRQQRLPEQVFTDMVREDVLLGKLNNVLRHVSYVSPDDVERAYREQTEKASIRFVKLSTAEVEGTPAITGDELEAYYADNSAIYELPEQRIVDYLLVDRGRLRQQVEIPEAELRAYFDENPDEFTREEQVNARHILIQSREGRDPVAELEAIKARIEGGEDFAQLARELSEDEGSAQRGGSLGFFGRGQMVEPFEEAAFGAEKGALVGPVETQYGAHLIEVLDHREGGLRPFDEVQRLINSRLVGEQVEELAEAKARELSTRIAEEQVTTKEQLEALAGEEEYLSFATTEPFGRTDIVPGIGRVEEFIDIAFGLEASAISNPVKLPRGWAILHLDSVNEPRVPTLDEVVDEVRTAVESEKRKEMAVQRLAQARDRIGAGEDFEQVVSDFGLEVSTSEEFGRFGTIAGLGREREVIDSALGLEEGQLSETIQVADGAVLFDVVSRQTADMAELDERRDELREQEANERLANLLRSLIQQRRLELAPKYDSQLEERYDLQQAA
ncbi:MAG: peptidyl-prolyl cis-trans isomerase [Acidobacteriota bacterium]